MFLDRESPIPDESPRVFPGGSETSRLGESMRLALWLHGAHRRSLTLRHDNGLVFGSRQYRALVKDHCLVQEYTAPYTPEQKRLCERFIRSFKEEGAWLRFSSLAHTRTVVAAFIHHFNTLRPHQALNDKSPSDYHGLLCITAA